MYLELTDISKKIGADEVLSGITLSMEKGKVYGWIILYGTKYVPVLR